MSQTFPIIPAGTKPFWFLVPMIGVMLVTLLIVGGLLLSVAIASQSATFTVSPEGLRLRAGLSNRQIPANMLQVEQVRILNLQEDGDYRPQRRRAGSSIPGYQAGWFRLRNGEQALIYLTDARRIVYIPTHQDYSVLLSVQQPEAMVQALQNLAR
jgi:hypothetical protein